MKIPLIFVILNCFGLCFAKPRLLITVDDFPCQKESNIENQEQINKTILAVLKRYGVHAIVFVITGMMTSSKHEDMLRLWINDGHDVGNHTFSHLKFSKTDTFKYKLDIINGEQVPKKILAESGKKLKYFRYPYLDHGVGNDGKDVRDFLLRKGYEIVHVTIDTRDWKYNAMMHREKRKALAAKTDFSVNNSAEANDDQNKRLSVKFNSLEKSDVKSDKQNEISPTELSSIEGNDTTSKDCRSTIFVENKITKIKRDYIEYVKSKLKENFKKQDTNIILFHVNLINAECLDEIISFAKSVGYSVD
jgi:peptidoglycan/xylan/chitin deacetylase (PgdA/CDA1 family)